MNYPLISEYIEAIRAAEDNFATINNLRPVLDEEGNPVMTSGNFAVVFKMRDEKSVKYYAVKCFLKDQPNRAENYRMIAEELEYVSSNFLTKFQYLDNELFVDSANADGDEFPVLLMDWVEGVNLDQYIRQHIDDSYQLHMLAYQFSRLAMWLMPQPFAHGDLKPDNIMVREDGTLVLIDYDGMFVPAMKGQKAREIGSPDFRHPARTENIFNEHIDDFSLVSILLSLRAIAEVPSMLEKHGGVDRLLFSEKDYRNIHSCQLLKELFPSESAELNTLVGLFIIALTQSDLSNVSFRLLSLKRPKEPEIEIINTEVTEEDMKDAWTDEFGVKYSKNGEKLLDCTNQRLTNYSIRKGTKIICNQAFDLCFYLQSINIPGSVTTIGDIVFYCCKSLHSVTLPDSVTYIGNGAFVDCFSLQSIVIANTMTNIGRNAFACCYSLKTFAIPNSVTSIGDETFLGCESLQSVAIPDSVISIGNRTFLGCSSLLSFTIPDSVTSIGSGAFKECSSLQSITIPDSVASITGNPFVDCTAKIINHSKYFTIFEGNLYTSDKRTLISYLSKEDSFIISDSVTSIGVDAFRGCSSLQSVSIPDSVASIGQYAFYECNSLQSVTIPDSVTSIGDGAFLSCESLRSVFISRKTYSRLENSLQKYSSKIKFTD